MAVDDDVSQEDKLLISAALFNSNSCCLDDGCGLTVQGKMHDETSLVSDPELKAFVRATMQHAKVQTIPAEDNFKRVRTNTASNSGNATVLPRSPATICSGRCRACFIPARSRGCQSHDRGAGEARPKRQPRRIIVG